jgi:hypothetical protein
MDNRTTTLSQQEELASYCANCNRRAAETRRRLMTSVSTLGRPEPVCRICARLVDDEMERVAHRTIAVDRAVARYRASEALDVDLVELVRAA